MASKPTHEQAQLHLQIYEERREPRLRQARDWFFANCFADTLDEAMRSAPPAPAAATNFMMVISYWDQALLHGKRVGGSDDCHNIVMWLSSAMPMMSSRDASTRRTQIVSWRTYRNDWGSSEWNYIQTRRLGLSSGGLPNKTGNEEGKASPRRSTS